MSRRGRSAGRGKLKPEDGWEEWVCKLTRQRNATSIVTVNIYNIIAVWPYKLVYLAKVNKRK